jgi:predicted DNA-binding transcriptional regulator AlpA
MDALINSKQAARLLGLSPRTLERHRLAGTGPRYIVLGRRLVRYRLMDIEAWIAANGRHSTSEPVTAAPIGFSLPRPNSEGPGQ